MGKFPRLERLAQTLELFGMDNTNPNNWISDPIETPPSSDEHAYLIGPADADSDGQPAVKVTKRFARTMATRVRKILPKPSSSPKRYFS